jgi:uncharacterized pyridoxamine 5'-phosphate oxidase family protein
MTPGFPNTKRRQAYGLRQRRIFNFLDERYVGVLSSVTPDGNPHGAVVYYAIGSNFKIRILTKTGTRKYDNLVHNDHVMLTVYDSGLQTTAQITGTAVERPGLNNINQAADAIFTKLGKSNEGMPPIMKLQAGEFTTFQIEPAQIRFAQYAKPFSGGYETLFESIESFDLRD